MGGGSSRRERRTPIPAYTPAGSPGITRTVLPVSAPLNPGIGGVAPINRDQQRELVQLNQTVANLNNQIQALQRGGVGASPQIPYGAYSAPGGLPSPTPYGISPLGGRSPLGAPSGLLPQQFGAPSGLLPQQFGAPSGLLPQQFGAQSPSGLLPQQFGASSGLLPQQFGAQSPYGYPAGGGSGPPAVYRDTDFASIANIAGLNPADVASLHREFINLTRGGTNKMDRVVFRQLLRDVLLQANNEHVDRVIEDMFITVDRNRDGFIDFPEFVGAFKDVLKQKPSDPYSYLNDNAYPDMLGDQLRASGVGSGIDLQPMSYIQQPQQLSQFASPGGLSVVPLASTGIQQMPVLYGGAAPFQISDANAPLITLDPSQSSYVIATPGQYMITQPTALQCVPLPRI